MTEDEDVEKVRQWVESAAGQAAISQSVKEAEAFAKQFKEASEVRSASNEELLRRIEALEAKLAALEPRRYPCEHCGASLLVGKMGAPCPNCGGRPGLAPMRRDG